MDKVEFYTENREFKIRFTKEKRFYSLAKFGQYKITIEFIDTLDNTIFSINTTEKEFYNALMSIHDFINSGGTMSDDMIYFSNNGDGTSYSLYIGVKIPNISYPSEDDDITELSFFHSSIQGNVLRLSFEASFYYLEDFIFNMFLILEDIPYLNDIADASILEYLQYTSDNSIKVNIDDKTVFNL